MHSIDTNVGATLSPPRRANEPCGRRHDGLLKAIVGTVIAVPSYATLRLIGRWAPARSTVPTTVDEGSLATRTVSTRRPSVRFMAFFVTAYRRSYLHRYFHRGKGACRFVPCCAEYTLLAVEKHGLIRGIRLAGARVARCTPSYRGDYLDFP